MTTHTTPGRSSTERTQTVQANATARARSERNRRWYRLGAWAGALILVAAIVAVAMLTSRPDAASAARPAPGFTLPTTTGSSVSLSDYRGQPVLLFFSEGAGCGPCTAQMAAIQKSQRDFDKAGVKVLPIVVDSREQIQPDLDAAGVTTPVLIDNGGIVSKKYDTLGKGMHAEKPGHSFILVNKDGTEIWNGDYPSMWLEPQKLLDEVTSRLKK